MKFHTHSNARLGMSCNNSGDPLNGKVTGFTYQSVFVGLAAEMESGRHERMQLLRLWKRKHGCNELRKGTQKVLCLTLSIDWQMGLVILIF